MMNRRLTVLALAAGLTGGRSFAGSMSGGATEMTQLLNNIQLGLQYAKQVQMYIMQGLQYKTQLENLILAQSPGISDVLGIINGISQMMAVGKSIGGTMAEIDKNFAQTFKNATAASLAENFTKWNNSGLDTLQAALKAAGKHRDQYAGDAAMLQDLYVTSQSTRGARDAIQMVAAINSEQVSQLHKLSDLISTQNIATSTYMANLTSQSQEQIKTDQAIRDGFKKNVPSSIPEIDTSNKTTKPWNIYPPK